MKMASILLAAAFAVTVLLVSWKAADNGALHMNGFGCAFYDGDGALVWADNSRAVITHSGNGNYSCSASGVANSTGKAVVYKDVPYGTPTGAGVGRITISASGNASVSVKVRP